MYINVNHKELERAASDISISVNHITSYSSGIADIHGGSAWAGADTFVFENRLKSLDDSNSSTDSIKKALKGYSDYLLFCAAKYKEAQANAVNRAMSLPN